MKRLFDFIIAEWEDFENILIDSNIEHIDGLLDIELNGDIFSYYKPTKIFYYVTCQEAMNEDESEENRKRLEVKYGKADFHYTDFDINQDWWYFPIKDKDLSDFFERQFRWRKYVDE